MAMPKGSTPWNKGKRYVGWMKKNIRSGIKSRLMKKIGMKFGRLRILSLAGRTSSGRAVWLCQCECGKTKKVVNGNLMTGAVRSCGCLIGESNISHGACRGGKITSEWITWKNLRNRCLNPKDKDFKNYGGRGIKVCERWASSFANFIADVGERTSPQHTLDRINNDGNYEPGNVRWATKSEQRKNQRKKLSTK